MTYDAPIWGALALTLTVLGGLLSWHAWRRWGARAGLRGIALSLLPIAAWLTGVLRLLTRILGAIGDWAAGFVFSPVVWVGIVVLGVAVVVYAASRLVPAKDRPAREKRRQKKPSEPARPGKLSATSGHNDEDFDEVADILRKHGIS